MQLRFLVVDDDRFMREMLPPMLERGFGAEGPPVLVDAVGAPEEVAARLLHAGSGERLVVLCDYNLKAARNGLDVLADVRAARPDAIRILFSGHTREEIRGIEGAGLDGFIEKPFRLQEIVAPLRAIVERRSLATDGGGRARRQEAVRALGGEEIVPALVRAATKGEGARVELLYEEAQRRGQTAEAQREATRALLWQNRVLELVATGAPLTQTLDVLARSIEEQAPGLLASVLLLDPSGTRLVHGAAPSLPEAYNRAVDGVPVGEGVGSCGTAAHAGRTIIVRDTRVDPLWASYRDLVVQHGLVACWSAPITSPGGWLLGTFALYRREPAAPDERELQLLELGAVLARVAIDSHRDRTALRESEERYRTLFRSIDEGFCILEVLFDDGGRAFDLRYVEVNPAFESQTGLKDPTGSTVREVQPGLEASWYERYGHVVLTGEPVRFEAHSAPFARWFDVFAFRIGPAEQRRVGVLFSDITRRKEAEAEREAHLAREKALAAEAAAARERLSNLIAQAPVPIALLRGPEHVIELANAGYEEVSGRRADELVGRSVREAFPEIAPTFYDLLDRVYGTGETFHGKEVPVTLRRGGELVETILDFVYHPSRDADGRVDGIIVVAHEVTGQVRARQMLEAAALEREALLTREREARADAAAQRERLQQIFLQAPAAVAVLEGPRFVFAFANALYEQVSGKPASALIGRPAVEVFPELGEQGFIDILERVRETKEPFVAYGAPVTLRQDGPERTIYLNFVYQPMVGPDGDVSILAHIVDVTQQVRAQQEVTQLAATLEARVRERTAALERTNRDLGSFSSAVSHDLRAPLRAVHHLIGAALETIPETAADARLNLDIARRSTEEMARLIDSLLSHARAAQGELRARPVDLSGLAEEVVAALRLASPARAVDVVIDPGLAATGDPRLLRSVLENLIGNAWKFTAREPKASIEVRAGTSDGATFLVRDNGIGFDMKAAADLYQPFKRLEGSREFEGSGIGLATVRRIVERHGGRVWAESAPGAGATFFVALP